MQAARLLVVRVYGCTVSSEQWAMRGEGKGEIPFMPIIPLDEIGIWNHHIWKQILRIHTIDLFPRALISGTVCTSLCPEVKVVMWNGNFVSIGQTKWYRKMLFNITHVQPADIFAKKITVSWLAFSLNNKVWNRMTRNPSRLFCQLNKARQINVLKLFIKTARV
jgi:hypothetical protein